MNQGSFTGQISSQVRGHDSQTQFGSEERIGCLKELLGVPAQLYDLGQSLTYPVQALVSLSVKSELDTSLAGL